MGRRRELRKPGEAAGEASGHSQGRRRARPMPCGHAGCSAAGAALLTSRKLSGSSAALVMRQASVQAVGV